MTDYIISEKQLQELGFSYITDLSTTKSAAERSAVISSIRSCSLSGLMQSMIIELKRLKKNCDIPGFDYSQSKENYEVHGMAIAYSVAIDIISDACGDVK